MVAGVRTMSVAEIVEQACAQQQLPAAAAAMPQLREVSGELIRVLEQADEYLARDST